VLFLTGVTWRTYEVTAPVAMCAALLLPFGLGCLFVERLRTLALGLLLGAGGVLFTAQALYG
jgi:hypothetical protein